MTTSRRQGVAEAVTTSAETSGPDPAVIAEAIARVKEEGPRSVRFMCLLAAPEGIKNLHDAHPDVPIFTAAVDERLNEKGFKYGKGGRTMQHDRAAWSLDTGSKGFLNRYSRSSVSEDMAEVYAFLLTRPKLVAERAAKDKVLASKVRVLKSHLRFFHGSVNNDFWRTPKPKPAETAKKKTGVR